MRRDQDIEPRMDADGRGSSARAASGSSIELLVWQADQQISGLSRSRDSGRDSFGGVLRFGGGLEIVNTGSGVGYRLNRWFPILQMIQTLRPKRCGRGCELLGVGVAVDVDPALFTAGDGGLGGEFQAVGVHRSLDRVGGGVNRNLHLLVPELGLVGRDLIVQLRGLMAEFEMSLAKLQDEDSDRGGADETDEEFKHC